RAGGGAAGTAVRGARGAAGGPARRRAARTVDLPVAAAGTARPAGQRDDPGEGADARARAVRGLGVLRQAVARASRGLEPPAVDGDADVRPGAERGVARELRRDSGAFLAARGADPGARRPAGVLRRSEVLRG